MVEHLSHEKRANWGFDVLSESYVDLVKAGIIDPAKVTRSALENAASVAGMILSTEALVTDLAEGAPLSPASGPRPGCTTSDAALGQLRLLLAAEHASQKRPHGLTRSSGSCLMY